MRIGELAKILGVSCSTIRFYERQGLISSGVSRTENGYRNYAQKDLEELQLIVKFKEFGLELKEIKGLLGEGSKSCGDLVSSLDAQILKCRKVELAIQRRISSLLAAREGCQTACEPSGKVRRCCV